MDTVETVYRYTVQLVEFLEDSKTERDEKIERIQEYLSKREDAMKLMKAPYSAEEMALGRRLIELNRKLKDLLECEKVMIQRDMKDLHLKKKSSQKYLNPYQALPAGGVLYDKKN